MIIVSYLLLAGLLVFLIWNYRSVGTFLTIFFPIFLKKLPLAVFTMFVVATTVFFLTKAAGGEEEMLLKEGRVDPKVYANLRAQWGLDKPLLIQYRIQMKELLFLNTVPSLHQNQKTFREVARDHAPVTARLAWRAMLLAVAFGIPIGVMCAVWHNRWVDQLGRVAALVGVSVPSFILASLAIFFFARRWQMIRATEWQNPSNLWLAGACLAAFPFAAILRLTRASMLEALREDYVRTARSKGVNEWVVVFRHALRNSLSAVVTYLGPVTAGLLVGSLIVEQIFAIPGMGDMFVKSVSNRDMPLILGITCFYSGLLVTANLIVDSLYPVLNPRLRTG